tara:strand:- start:1202 stop:1465 length:264 start_codon:yes stop_codon:yes gene_type:complete
MMMTVMCGPPQAAFLSGCHRKPTQEELKDPARLEATVGKVAVVSCGHAKHSNEVQRKTEEQVLEVYTCKDSGKAQKVQRDKGSTAYR